MAKRSGLGQNLYIGGYDLSGDIGSVSNAHGGPALMPATGLDKYAHERIPGLIDAGIGFQAWFNDATGQAHDVLSALPTSPVHLMYVMATTVGAPAGCMIARQINYDPTRDGDGGLSFAIEANNQGTGLEWSDMLTAGKRTDTGAANGASDDGGAAQAAAIDILTSSIADPTVITTDGPHGLETGDSVIIAGHTGSTPAVDGQYTATVTGLDTFTVPVNVSADGTDGTVIRTSTRFGLSAYLQVFAFTGTDVTVKLQHAPDDSAWANITGGAFAAVTTAPVTERIATATTAKIKRYVRVVTSTTGGFSSLVFAVAYMRAPVATIL